MIKNGKMDLKKHALRYEEIIRKHKEETRRKQNNDDLLDVNIVQSRVQSDVRRREKENLLFQADRIKQYSKNVKDIINTTKNDHLPPRPRQKRTDLEELPMVEPP